MSSTQLAGKFIVATQNSDVSTCDREQLAFPNAVQNAGELHRSNQAFLPSNVDLASFASHAAASSLADPKTAKLDTIVRITDRRNGLIGSPPQPSAACDPIQGCQMLVNLGGNGIKFNDNPDEKIGVGCMRRTPPPFYVRDNGIGIEATNHTTVGLTTARRMVERHADKIGLDRTPGPRTASCYPWPPTAQAAAI